MHRQLDALLALPMFNQLTSGLLTSYLCLVSPRGLTSLLLSFSVKQTECSSLMQETHMTDLNVEPDIAMGRPGENFPE